MADITDKRLLYLKGVLFLVGGLLASTLILVECPSAKVALLLAVAVWCFARAYYFAFYVVEHYVDPCYRYSGLVSFAWYALAKRKTRAEKTVPLRQSRRRPRGLSKRTTTGPDPQDYPALPS